MFNMSFCLCARTRVYVYLLFTIVYTCTVIPVPLAVLVGERECRLAPKVLAAVQVPDHRDLLEHQAGLGHGEARGGPQQVRAASGPGEVAVFHADGARV